ncbi:MAG: hypothetical protein ABFE08_17855 [Armatimonadia bacterium]
MKMWLKHTEDGSVYDWNEYLAKHPKLVAVSDEEMFPEKYAPPQIVAKMEAIKAKRTEQLALFTDIIPEEVPPTNEELDAELTVRTRKRNK